jgi:hypothetical protein
VKTKTTTDRDYNLNQEKINMANNRNRPPLSAVARDIQGRLAAAQSAPAPATCTPAVEDSIRVTKTGEIVPPGEELPKDSSGNPVAYSAVPDATFHGGGAR